MSTENEKIKDFLDLMVINKKHATELVKQFLVQYNPSLESLTELKLIIENQNIDLENETFDFINKFGEYKKSLRKSIEIQQRESMNNNFESLMAKNFPQAI